MANMLAHSMHKCALRTDPRPLQRQASVHSQVALRRGNTQICAYKEGAVPLAGGSSSNRSERSKVPSQTSRAPKQEATSNEASVAADGYSCAVASVEVDNTSHHAYTIIHLEVIHMLTN